VERASRALAAYTNFYHHGMPFSLDALKAELARCPADEPQRCAELRAWAKEAVGPLGAADATDD
jgi:hypothetical protein